MEMFSRSADQARYEAGLRRQEMAWRYHSDRVLHSDRGTVEMGIAALKSAILVNSGALIALLAFIGQLWDHQPALVLRVVSASHAFVFGLILAGVCVAVSYLHQSLWTEREVDVLALHSDIAHYPERPWIKIMLQILRTAVLMCATGSLILFVLGMTAVASVFG